MKPVAEARAYTAGMWTVWVTTISVFLTALDIECRVEHDQLFPNGNRLNVASSWLPLVYLACCGLALLRPWSGWQVPAGFSRMISSEIRIAATDRP
ncbi:hypothetical protein NKJ81_30260 [Mesorhizobium sp. M0018]|uniref:hypothetical protein n=1 Tax=Mesorhizobium sp. M0018 TaxID=2956844 RepID=UPI00333B570B